MLIKSRPCLKLGHVRLKSKPLDHISERLCVYYIGHNYDLIFIKLCQNDNLNEIFMNLHHVSNSHVWSKTRLLGQILKKTPIIHSLEGSVFMKLCENGHLYQV